MTNRFPVIIEAALNGATPKALNPVTPIEPEEIASDAIACIDAGASIIHTHCSEPHASPQERAQEYLEAYELITAERPDAIVYPTVGFSGETFAERYDHHAVLAEAGVLRMGLLDTGSVNLGAIGDDGMPTSFDFVYRIGPADIGYELETCNRYGLGGSIAIFEPGWLRPVIACYQAGTLPQGSMVKFYFSAAGYLGRGEPMFSPTPIREALELYLTMFDGIDIPWAVAVLGGSLLDLPLASEALERGGHLRVGLEDRFDAVSNVDEVRAAVQLCQRHDRPVASCHETAGILGLQIAV